MKSVLEEQRQTAPAVIAERIREAIVRGQLRPGQPLRQAEIAERFGVSRIPVREALSQLEGEGWVSSIPHRGVVVTELNAEDVRDLSDIRIELETLALRLAVPNMSEVTLERAEAILDEIDAEPTIDAWADYNLTFHCTLYEAANRPRLLTMIKNTHRLTSRYLLVHVAVLNYRERGQDEHRRLLAACREGNIEQADAVLRAHIGASADMLEAYLRQRARATGW
ncbi:MAG: GntR family transcriptional regulator [Candidatus Eremiobacteraeota bacterium]|nr:GntR family transcriptional regulator [Candidatus Eremiobacteraeota bacterium]